MLLLILLISALCLGYGHAVLVILGVACAVWLVWSLVHLVGALLYGLAAGVVWGVIGVSVLANKVPQVPGLTVPCRVERWWYGLDDTPRRVLGWTLGLGGVVALTLAAHLLLPR